MLLNEFLKKHGQRVKAMEQELLELKEAV